MSKKLAEIAKQLGIEVSELKVKINELGFEVSSKARVIEDDVAELVLDELGEKAEEVPKNVAEEYDEMIAEEREREIVKSQRKKMAGKDQGKKSTSDTVKPVVATTVSKTLEITDSISVKEYSEKTGINAAKIIGELMKNGILANINQQLDFETVQIISDDMGIKLKRKRDAAEAEDFMSGDISNLLKEDDASVLVERPPVVCVMGHVDHGKTMLLDAIRDANVIEGESGGITQHIGAYQVEKKNRLITFLDTPGHEAFTSMRARGAKVTDIAILVVAATEGVKPQTIEAINHAKEAEVPIIVAINKMDLEGANPDKVKAELAEHGLQPEDWGGDTVMIPVSALKGDGISEILDMILLTADLLELKANPNREAVCSVVEAHLDPGLGPVATVLVNTGTLKIMNNVIVGNTYGRIKMMCDHTGKKLRTVGPSTPVKIAGLHLTPKSGDILQVVKDEKTARARAEEIGLLARENDFANLSGLGRVLSGIKSDKILRLVVKADTKGSLEAIKQSLDKIKDEEVAIRIIHGGVGSVTKSDVMMASASTGLILGFHVDYDSPHVKKVAEREVVEVKFYKVIYALLEEMKDLLSGLLDAEIVEIRLGRAQVKQVFLTKKKEMIVGCKVLSGKVKNKAKLRILRGKDEEGEDLVVGEGRVDSLRKVDDVVKEVNEGNECGIKFVGDISIEEGDIFEIYEEEERERSVA